MKLISVLFLVKTKLDFGFKAGFFFYWYPNIYGT